MAMTEAERAAWAHSARPCLYCSLPAADMARCEHGFPGCGRADDLLLVSCIPVGAITQSRFMSLVEAWGNIAIGFGINFAGNMTLLPLFGLPVTATQSLGIGVVFTVVSVIRSYYVRRGFEWLRVRHGNWTPPWGRGAAGERDA